MVEEHKENRRVMRTPNRFTRYLMETNPLKCEGQWLVVQNIEPNQSSMVEEHKEDKVDYNTITYRGIIPTKEIIVNVDFKIDKWILKINYCYLWCQLWLLGVMEQVEFGIRKSNQSKISETFEGDT